MAWKAMPRYFCIAIATIAPITIKPSRIAKKTLTALMG